MDSTVSTLLSRGGLRERCTESVGKLKCLNCGETASSAKDWESNADRCPICLGSERKFACDRCEELFDEPGSGGEHPCRSVARFERTHVVTFEPEMLATEETQRREAERLAAEESRRIDAERREVEESRRRRSERLAAEEAHRREAERLAAEAAAEKTARFTILLRKLLVAAVGVLLFVLILFTFYKANNPEFRYEGERLNGKANGRGKIIGPKGVISEGIYSDDKLISGIFKSDGAHYEGELLNNKFHGKGVFIWPNGNRYEGDFLDGLSTGNGIFIFQNGDRYEGHFLNDKFSGKGIFKFKNGDRCEGDFINDKLSGKGVYVWKNGNRYEGGFLDHRFHGKGEYIWPTGNRYEGSFFGGKFSGNGVYISPNGDRYESVLLDGKNLDGNFSYQEKKEKNNIGKLNMESVTGQPSAAPKIPIPEDATSFLERANSAVTATNSIDGVSPAQNPGQPEAVSLLSSDLRHINIRRELIRISELINFKAISIHISAMKTYSHFGNAEQVELAASRLTSLVPMLTRGDRRTARKLNAEALIVMGNSASRAVDLLFEAMKADSADVEIIGNLAYALYQEEKFWEASYACMISLAISPRRASSWSTLALATLKMRDDDDIPSMLTRTDLSIANFKNAYRYSTKPEKTIEYLTTLSNSDPDPAVRALALRVLPTLAKVTRIEESNSKTSSTVEKAASEMRPGVVFKDCANCPEMVVLPSAGGGSPTMAIGQAEVTQGQWQAVMGYNPSHFQLCGADCPVEQVSWDDAQAFIQKLKAKTGKTYRLPTEQEWEYACLGGQQTEYCGGSSVDGVAWHNQNSGDTTHPERTKLGNGFGLYDMSGNVWEWTDSCWQGYCRQRVLRGGSWNFKPQFARASFRFREDSANSSDDIGFRLARMLP